VICQARIIEVVYIRTDSVLLQYGDQLKVKEIFNQASIKVREFAWGEKKFSQI
jgi:deoxycytidylate deaminase